MASLHQNSGFLYTLIAFTIFHFPMPSLYFYNFNDGCHHVYFHVFQPLIGTCVYFLRLDSEKGVSTSAIAEQIFCGYINSAPVMSQMLASFEETIGKVLVPLLKEQEVSIVQWVSGC